MAHQDSPARLDVDDRLKRIQQRLVFRQEKIDEVADVLDEYHVNGVDASDAQCQEYHQKLQNHRRQITHLKQQQRALLKEKERNAERDKLAKDERHRRAVAEVQSHRQPAIGKHGIEASIKSAESRAYEYARPDASKGIFIPMAAFPWKSRPAPHIDPLKRARMTQITHEHARLTSGLQPVDPFATDLTDGSSLTENQLSILQRISKKPKLVDLYPYTRSFLDETPHDCTQESRVSAKAAMDQYHEAVETGTLNRLPQEMQDLHNNIAQQETLSDLAKLVLLIVTFVPYGRYTTFNAMREWIHDVRHMCPDSHIASSLKKGASLFSLDEVPAHRIVQRNGGIGNFNGRACDWGDHLPELDIAEREALLLGEGCRLDKNGRILGGRLEMHEVEEAMKGTMVEKYIRSFPYRFGGWD